MLHMVYAAAAGVAFGVFYPSIARKLHALFSKEAKKGAAIVDAGVQDVKKKL